jgi:hypothetical protein
MDMKRLLWCMLPGLFIVPEQLSAGSDWLTFTEDTDARIVAAPGLSTEDPEEKDYAWGDVDQDGWIDLVVARKAPFFVYGKRPNVFFHNENGVLVDRTAAFVSASSVIFDQGFLTPTNDQDIALADVNGDSWLDIVTSVSLSQADHKPVSHPRVYVNLGEDGAGAWLGFKYEESRIPTLPAAPNFCGLGVGDVTGDGYVDLYLTDYNSNLNDRLLINGGGANPGHFTDQSAQRVADLSWLNSLTGNSSAIADMNGDGWNDVVKGDAGPVKILYNVGSGFFAVQEQVYLGAAYNASVGDLNNDGKLDIVIVDDAVDRQLLNTGNGPDALANFTSSLLPAGTDGFGSQSLTIDLDSDGQNDLIIADMDLQLPGCTRVSDILRNDGQSPNVGFSSDPANIPESELTGVYNFAVFDLNNDGALDIILGKCSGMQVWMGTPPTPICPEDLNGDSTIDGSDLGLMLLQFGTKDPHGDLNVDGIVDGADLGILLLAWGPCI